MGDSTENENLISRQYTANCPMLDATVNNIRTGILIDTGAEFSAISDKFIRNNKKYFKNADILPVNNTSIKTATNTTEVVKQQILVNMKIKDVDFDAPMLVVKNLISDVILGIDQLNRIHAVINLEQRSINFRINDKNYTADLSYKNNRNNTRYECNEPIQIKRPEIKIRDNNGVCIEQNHLPNAKHKQILRQLLDKHSDIFSDTPKLTNTYTHKIEVTDESKFVRRTYPIPIHHQHQVELEIQEMLKNGIIERSNSNFLNPLVVAKKKNNDIRLCLDMRNLNTITKKSYDCAPNVDDLFRKCLGVKYMSRLDLTSSFWQIPLEKDSRKYTAFLYKNRCYQFKVVPFGHVTSLAAIVKCLEIALGPEVESFVSGFVDDILVVSKTFDEHMQHLDVIFNKLKRANLAINKEKCEFIQSKIKFLGHIISAEGIQTDPEKICGITNFPTPRKNKDIRAFLGLTGYYRKFIPTYSDTVAPLLELLKKGVKWKWETQHQKAFDAVKQLYTNNLHLYHPNEKGTYVLYTDASDIAIGGVLYQRDEHNEHRPIAYVNRTLRGAEKNYFTSEKEVLAVVYALTKLRYYLSGTHFEIHSDNQALSFLLKCRLINARMTRWIMAIQEYNFTIKYCKAIDNKTADTLSRYISEHTEEHKHDPNEVQILQMKFNLPETTKQKLKNIGAEQNNDPNIVKIKQEIIQKDNPRYKLKEEVLCKLIHQEWKILLPQHMLPEITWACHESLAHAGAHRTYLVMMETFVCNNMMRKIRTILKTCHTCQTANYPNYNTCIEMGSIVTSKKGELLCIDFLGPLPRATRRMRHIIVCVDAFTKAVRLYPVQRPTTKAVLNAILKKYIPTHGPVEKILTDQGKQFQNKLWAETLGQHGIEAILTAIRRPQGNLAERVNKELSRLFRIYCHEAHNLWPQYLSFFEKTINENYNFTTGYTPAELETGIQPQRIWSDVIKTEKTSNLPIPPHIKTEHAKINIQRSTRKRAEKFNQQHKTVKFREGETVLLRANPVGKSSDNTARKFFRLFDGPYILKERVGKNTFIVYDQRRDKTVGKFHGASLRKYFSHD